METPGLFAFAVATTRAFIVTGVEPVFRCALCSVAVCSDGVQFYPYCSAQHVAEAAAENAADGAA